MGDGGYDIAQHLTAIFYDIDGKRPQLVAHDAEDQATFLSEYQRIAPPTAAYLPGHPFKLIINEDCPKGQVLMLSWDKPAGIVNLADMRGW